MVFPETISEKRKNESFTASRLDKQEKGCWGYMQTGSFERHLLGYKRFYITTDNRQISPKLESKHPIGPCVSRIKRKARLGLLSFISEKGQIRFRFSQSKQEKALGWLVTGKLPWTDFWASPNGPGQLLPPSQYTFSNQHLKSDLQKTCFSLPSLKSYLANYI